MRFKSRDGFGVVGILLVVAVVIVAAASGLFVAHTLSTGTSSGQADLAAEQDDTSSSPAMEFIDFGSVVANLAEGRLTRYLKVDITLQVSGKDAGKVREMMSEGEKAVFKNWLIGYLSDKKRDEVNGTANINRLRREIQDGFNAILAEQGEGKIDSVLFTEFNVQ